MGFVISEKELFRFNMDTLMKPIIYCKPDIETVRVAVSLNVIMAERLITINENRRAMHMENCLREALAPLADGAVIKDFDVMFNPKYEIDVLRVLIAVSKVKPFEAIWPGKYENNNLIYAEEGYKDYKVYDIDKYDIMCVV